MAIVAFLRAMLTGLFVFSVSPLDYLGNDAFLVKLALLFLAGRNALPFQFVVSTPVRFIQAGLYLLTWLGKLLAGRLIGFV